MNKYNNRHIRADGYAFDSQAEYNRYCELKLMVKNGDIASLEVHPVYLLQPDFMNDGKKIKPINYEADFEYLENGIWITEDVKGVQTAVFKMKWKMLLYKYKDRPYREFRMVEV